MHERKEKEAWPSLFNRTLEKEKTSKKERTIETRTKFSFIYTQTDERNDCHRSTIPGGNTCVRETLFRK